MEKVVHPFERVWCILGFFLCNTLMRFIFGQQVWVRRAPHHLFGTGSRTEGCIGRPSTRRWYGSPRPNGGCRDSNHSGRAEDVPGANPRPAWIGICVRNLFGLGNISCDPPTWEGEIFVVIILLHQRSFIKSKAKYPPPSTQLTKSDPFPFLTSVSQLPKYMFVFLVYMFVLLTISATEHHLHQGSCGQSLGPPFPHTPMRRTALTRPLGVIKYQR